MSLTCVLIYFGMLTLGPKRKDVMQPFMIYTLREKM